VEFEPGSFRDRTGRVFYAGGAVYRALSERALAEWEEVSSLPFYARLLAEGKVIESERPAPSSEPPSPPGAPAGGGAWAAVLRHPRLPFVSYPYEWCFGMLREAALLQLDVLAAALAEDATLKDATPYNVQWRHGRPLFIDVLSFRRLKPGEPWVGYRQFCQLFLYPLMLESYRGAPFQPWLRGRLDGIAPADMRRLLGARDLLRGGVLAHVVLHSGSERRFEATGADLKRELAAAGFSKELILGNVRGLRRLVEGLAPGGGDSAWSRYEAEHGYAPADREAKERFVAEAAETRRWRLAWDLGANTGAFSRLAAPHADLVVALEGDREAVERLYRSARADNIGNLLPLVCDLADPSPAQGWRGAERKDLPARGRPDLVLCLALVHHLVIGANIGLADLLDWLAGLTSYLVFEWVDREDPMVERLLRHREEPYADYDREGFAREFAERFEVLRRESLPSGRRHLLFARSRRAAPDGGPGGTSGPGGLGEAHG
jgi:hypothetical protein